jgi:hypothetical protein
MKILGGSPLFPRADHDNPEGSMPCRCSSATAASASTTLRRRISGYRPGTARASVSAPSAEPASGTADSPRRRTLANRSSGLRAPGLPAESWAPRITLFWARPCPQLGRPTGGEDRRSNLRSPIRGKWSGGEGWECPASGADRLGTAIRQVRRRGISSVRLGRVPPSFGHSSRAAVQGLSSDLSPQSHSQAGS